MILNILLLIGFSDIFRISYANEQYQFGTINHQTFWYFHCPKNHTKISVPPSNDLPLISYECPRPSTIIEIRPIEIDFTFLCRLESRLIWLLVDLYQYDADLSLITSDDIEIKIQLNHKIQLNNYKSEINNFTKRFILISAFYIPFELIEILSNQQIEIHIEIKNVNRFNYCHFSLKDDYSWQTFINDNCNSLQSHTLFIQSAECHFYSTSKSAYTNPHIQVEVEIPTTTRSSKLPDFNVVPVLNEEQSIINSTQYVDFILATTSTSYNRDYLLLQQTYREMFASAVRSTTNTSLTKLTFSSSLIILVLLILILIYIIYYHLRLRSSANRESLTAV